MPQIQIDVDGVDKTLNDIRRDLHRGMEKAADRIAENAKQDARSRIKEKDAIFNTEVYSGFRNAETYNSPSRVKRKLYNDVEHAEALEKGAEYGNEGPPVVALLPWVVRKMNWKAASRDTDFDSNKNYIPDSWNGDNDHDRDSDSDSPAEDVTENRTGEDVEFVFNQENQDLATKARDDFIGAWNEIRDSEITAHGYDMAYLNHLAQGDPSKPKLEEINSLIDTSRALNQEAPNSVGAIAPLDELKEIREKLKELKEADVEDDLIVHQSVLSNQDESLEAGLTLNSQVNDLLIEGGDVSELDEELQRDITLHLNEYLFDSNLRKVGSIGVGDHETIQGALEDDSHTITVPDNLFEYNDWLGKYTSEKYYGNDFGFSHNPDDHLEHIIDHQVGRDLYKNLSDDGIAEFRTAFGIRDSDDDGVWELPDNVDEVSDYAEKGELEYFAEVYAGKEFTYHNRSERDFMKRVRNADPDLFEDQYIERDRDLPDYTVGHRYSEEDLEIVTEDDLLDVGTEDFTTNFNPRHYHIEDSDKDGFWDNSSFRERTEYVFTSDKFEGAKSLTYKRRDDTGQFWDNDFDYHIEDLTLQAVPENDVIFNNLTDDSELIVKKIDRFGSYTDENQYIKMKHLDEETIQSDDLVEAENVFTGEIYELHPEGIVGTREDNPDLWAEEVEVAGEFTEESLNDVLSESFDETNIDNDHVYSTIKREPHHIVVEDKNTGEIFRVNQDTLDRDNDFRTIHPDEDGDHKEWAYDYDDLSNNDISIKYLNENVVDYHNLEIDDDILVDPSQFYNDPKFTDEKYRATVKGFDRSGDPYVVPFGQNPKEGEVFGVAGFIDKREDIPGWDSKNFEKGTKVTVETLTGKHTGRLDIPESYGSTDDNLSYEANQMRMQTDDGEFVYFQTTDIVSYDRDGYGDQYQQYEGTFDTSASAWEKYDGGVGIEDFKPRHFDPMEGYDDLLEGTGVSYDTGNRTGQDSINVVVRDDDGDVKYYVLENGIEPTPDQITRFDGQGSDVEDLSVGDDVSTGSSFGEITDITDTGGVYVDFGDGNDQAMNAYELKPVSDGLPVGTKVLLFDNRTGEKNIVGYVTEKGIEGEDGKIYNHFSLHPADIMAYNL